MRYPTDVDHGNIEQRKIDYIQYEHSDNEESNSYA